MGTVGKELGSFGAATAHAPVSGLRSGPAGSTEAGVAKARVGVEVNRKNQRHRKNETEGIFSFLISFI